MLKKLGLIGVMALAALAFAIPVTAASANWKTEGVAITKDEPVEFTGKAGFNLVGSETGAHATVHIKATLTKGTTTATVTSFQDTECTGTGPGLGGLRCTGTPVGLPWLAHWNGSALEITGFHLTTHYYSPADPGHTTPLTTTTLTGTVLATPDNSAAIGSVELEGQETHAGGNAAEITGTLPAIPAGMFGV